MNLPTCLRTRWESAYAWLRVKQEVVDENVYLRAALAESEVTAAWATARMAALEAAVTCSDPARHVALAARLEQALAELSELKGAEAHRASLTPRRGQ